MNDGIAAIRAGRGIGQIGLKTAVRGALYKSQPCGRTCLVQSRLLLTQHFFAPTAGFLQQCSELHRSSH